MFIQPKSLGSFSGAMRVVLLCAAGAALTACAITDAVHVRKGKDPEFADDMVRFRTTYYFRTIDKCEESEVPEGDLTFGNRLPKNKDQIFIRKPKITKVLSDSLYRFRMTGKASPWSSVHFESGTLKSWQIDPFGSTAAFDKQNNRFYWKSQASTQIDADESKILNDVERLTALAEKLRENSPLVANRLDTLIVQKIASVSASNGEGMPLSTASEYAALIRKASASAVVEGAAAAGVVAAASVVKVNAVTQPTAPSDTKINPAALRAEAIRKLDGALVEMNKEVDYLNKVVLAIKADPQLTKASKALATAMTSITEMQEVRQQVVAAAPPLNMPSKEALAIRKASADAVIDGETLAKAVKVEGEIGAKPISGIMVFGPVITKEAALIIIDGALGEMRTEVEYLSKLKEAINKPIQPQLDKAEQALLTAKTSFSTMNNLRLQLAGADGPTTARADQTGQCSAGMKFRRGFQLIGPEGVKTFDQDDRLLMAMSSSPAPVIGALQELSGRMLMDKAGKSDRLLPLVQERILLIQAQNMAKGMGGLSAEGIDKQLEEIIKKLGESIQ